MKTPPLGESCGACHFGIETPDTPGDMIVCRRYAQQPDPAARARWPLVRKDAWCGEYRVVTPATFDYTFEGGTTAPPGAGGLRFNATTPASATLIWADAESRLGLVAVSAVLLQTPVGARVYVQEAANHSQYASFVTTAAVVARDTYVEFPVEWRTDSGTAISHNAQVELLVTSWAVPAVRGRRDGKAHQE